METHKTSPWQITDAIKLLADGLTLVYHEARNVRFLIKEHYEPRDAWEPLVNLPNNRVKAWEDLQTYRKAARSLSTADKVAQVFENRFECSLEDFERLYNNPNWKHAKDYGGHAWCRVTQVVMKLRDALGSSDHAEIAILCDNLLEAKHNNGLLRDKIKRLDCQAGIITDSWW